MDLLNYLVRSPRGALPVVSRHQPQVVGNENGNYAGISPASASMQSDRNTAAQPAPVAKSVGILSFEEWAATSEATAGSVTPPDVNAVGTLHMLCTRCGVVPEFTLTESPLYSFHAKLVLGNQTIEGHGPFSSKKEAKKYVAAQGIPILQALLDAEKRAAAVQQHELKRGSSCAGSVDGDAQENWVGILHEFCQGTHITLPRYSFAQPVQSAFTCTISLSPWPTLVFGDVNRVHPAKKAAKSVAAQAAVDWLRAEGHMQGNEPARKKLCTESSAASDGDGADVVQATLKGPSCAQQVVDLCATLGIGPPTYRVEDEPAVPAMYSGSAYFSPASGIKGPVGEVRHVYGKKNAKEELAKQVFKYLEQETARRKVQATVMREEHELRAARTAAVASILAPAV